MCVCVAQPYIKHSVTIQVCLRTLSYIIIKTDFRLIYFDICLLRFCFMQSHNRFDCFLTNYTLEFFGACSAGMNAHSHTTHITYITTTTVAWFVLPLATSFDKWNWPPKNRALLLVLLNWNWAMYVHRKRSI